MPAEITFAQPLVIVGRSTPFTKRAPFAYGLVATPVRTPLIRSGDDLPELVARAVRGIARPGDVVAVSETAVAIAQNRMLAAETIRPGRLAYALSRRAGALATVNQPESLQLVIDHVGAWRVVVAAAANVLGRLVGRRGLFYSVLGEAISAIDGYTGTLPPFERTIVLGPQAPGAAAAAIAARTGTGAVVVDANDLGIATVLGASPGVAREATAAALRANPHGNGDEQTPIVVLAWRGSGGSPLRGGEGVNATVGSALLFVAVLVTTLVVGRPLIAFLQGLSFKQRAYEDAPQTHAVKTGTPTMGGVLFAIGLVAAAPFAQAASGVGYALLLLGVGCGAVGAIDDLTSIRGGRNRGLRAGPKFALTALVGIAFLFAIGSSMPDAARDVLFTFGGVSLAVPHWLWYGFALLALLATTHAVNLTDGLDGLAGGTILPPLAVFAYLGWRMHLQGVTFVDVALAASILGFLAFNRHPARVFMGDTGALALGGVLAGSAVLTGNLLLLPLVGGVFAAEALSVIVQVAYFKTTRKRIFRMSPLHHHFELGGWPETKVTARFWTASALLSLAGAALAR